MRWDDVLELSPLRLRFITRAVDNKQTYAEMAVFDGRAATIDEKALSSLNAKLREL